MEFQDLTPKYPATPWTITQDFREEGDQKPKIEIAQAEIRSHDKRLICQSRMISRLRHEQMNLFELLGAAPAMLELLVKLHKAGYLTGVDHSLVENLIEKFYTKKPTNEEAKN